VVSEQRQDGRISTKNDEFEIVVKPLGTINKSQQASLIVRT
jgi:hypothetical protein